MQVYSDDTSNMTLQILYVYGGNYELPEGTFLRLTKVDGVEGYYGEAPLTHVETSERARYLYEASFTFDRAFAKAEYITFTAYQADGTELFPLKFVLDYFNSDSGTWPMPDTTPPVPTLPAPPTPTPLPTLSPDTTEPPYNTAYVKCTYNLQDKVTKYSHYNVTFRQYADFNTLNVFFFYKADLPEGAYMRVVSAGGLEGDYGEAVIGPANVEGTDPTLLNAKIFTRALPAAATLTVECCSSEGEVLFPLVFTVKDVSYPAGGTALPSGGNSRPSGTATPVPPGYGYDHWNGFNGPSPTPWYPTIDTWDDWVNGYNSNSGTSWIEDGMNIQPSIDYGFVVVTPNPYGYTSPGSGWYNGGSYWGW